MISPSILVILLASLSTGFIMPMTKTDGSADLSIITNHVTLLEQMVVDLRTELKTTTTEVVVLKTKLEDQEKTSTAELNSVKDELVAMKKELGLTTSELINVKDELNSLKASVNQNPAPINQTVLDVMSSDLKANTKEISTLKTNLYSALGESKMNISEIETGLRKMIMDCNNTQREMLTFITSQINDTKRDVDEINMKQNETSIKVDHVQDTVFRDISVELNETEAKLQIMESQLKSEISALQLSTSTSIAQLKTHVKYQVQQEKQYLIIEGANTLKFDKVKTNDGNGYDFSTGKFTAPVSGTYLFWANVLTTTANTNTDFQMFINGVIVAQGASHTREEVMDTVVITYLTNLKAGDQVWYAKADYSTGKLVYGYLYSSYGGVML